MSKKKVALGAAFGMGASVVTIASHFGVSTWAVLSSVGVWLRDGMEVPGWLILLLPVSVPMVLTARAWRRLWKARGVTRAEMFGVVWVWRYAKGRRCDLKALCPTCNLPLVKVGVLKDGQHVTFFCELCNAPKGERMMVPHDVIGKEESDAIVIEVWAMVDRLVEKEIQDRISPPRRRK